MTTSPLAFDSRLCSARSDKDTARYVRPDMSHHSSIMSLAESDSPCLVLGLLLSQSLDMCVAMSQ